MKGSYGCSKSSCQPGSVSHIIEYQGLAEYCSFKMARAADPAGKRTVGIITKCDALQAGDEPGVSSVEVSEKPY